MNEKFIRDRISELRIQKNISERSMSIDLGHSPSYIHSIVSGKALPSMTEFLYICDYFNISPKEFFDEGTSNPAIIKEVIDDLSTLDEKQITNIHQIIKGLKR
ncbi:transcriptional regulator with XRE-family HTH domain [Hydrogenoanaerobacterium saccharovorans]|uniref:Transcriptional regulator, contains XRE-family HTH domain n=1 Tax=Hydrogenoanaerobacterium saccharovorans TaxID=474960 RepID=A0A1H8AP86_9FIRM|nr:helix-turn-helix transcriptional regulator [Hydrogenoanaerobacterium saccharovorans]RPF47825.1 transcriptional regulator with XRE-family HTH domain [Hydrogenoanaerobacterium saccharovorans]SEM72501.1 Transcriptional regulator, contains XRE-family HTH domain [Hydrogenoanaerobacterium saccharovorans]